MQHGIISRIAKLQGRANSPDFTGLDLITKIGAADTPEMRNYYETRLAAWQVSKPELQGEFPALDAIAKRLTKELGLQ